MKEDLEKLKDTPAEMDGHETDKKKIKDQNIFLLENFKKVQETVKKEDPVQESEIKAGVEPQDEF